MARIIVGVLRGGTSSEYELSLKSGAAIIAALPEEKYETRDLFIDRKGYWHLRGTPATPGRALAQVDVVLNALHGGVGEDGSVARMLSLSGVPYAGSAPLPSALALNKIRARALMNRAGLRQPQALSFSLRDKMDTGQMALLVHSKFPPPYLVKPPAEGSSHGIVFAATLHELPDKLADVLDEFGSALVEEYVRGREATVGLIERFRGEPLYALPPAEVMLPAGHRFLPAEAYELGNVHRQIPSTFSFEEKEALMDASRAAHRALGLSHFSQVDLILAPSGIYILEADASPHLYSGAAFPAMLEAVGSSLPQFLEHSIALATGRA